MSSSLPTFLLSGYHHFLASRFTPEKRHYEKLARDGQKPSVMVIGCCDSRAAPETIFDARAGELFVVRNVANLVPPSQPDGDYHGTSAAIEYAVDILGVAHVIVMGHARCGGVRGYLDGLGASSQTTQFVGPWINLLRQAVNQLPDLSCQPVDTQAITLEQAAIRQSLANLHSFSFIQDKLANGSLSLHGLWFDVSNGALYRLDETRGVFLPLAPETIPLFAHL
jgi:carbonic anhydrase